VHDAGFLGVSWRRQALPISQWVHHVYIGLFSSVILLTLQHKLQVPQWFIDIESTSKTALERTDWNHLSGGQRRISWSSRLRGLSCAFAHAVESRHLTAWAKSRELRKTGEPHQAILPTPRRYRRVRESQYSLCPCRKTGSQLISLPHYINPSIYLYKKEALVATVSSQRVHVNKVFSDVVTHSLLAEF